MLLENGQCRLKRPCRCGAVDPIGDPDQQALVTHPGEMAAAGNSDGHKVARPHRSPRSWANAAACSLSDGFGSPARRPASARSRSRLRIFQVLASVGRESSPQSSQFCSARGAERPHCVTHVSGMNCHLSQEGHLPPTFVDDWRPKLPLELPLVPDCARLVY